MDTTPAPLTETPEYTGAPIDDGWEVVEGTEENGKVYVEKDSFEGIALCENGEVRYFEMGPHKVIAGFAKREKIEDNEVSVTSAYVLDTNGSVCIQGEYIWDDIDRGEGQEAYNDFAGVELDQSRQKVFIGVDFGQPHFALNGLKLTNNVTDGVPVNIAQYITDTSGWCRRVVQTMESVAHERRQASKSFPELGAAGIYIVQTDEDGLYVHLPPELDHNGWGNSMYMWGPARATYQGNPVLLLSRETDDKVNILCPSDNNTIKSVFFAETRASDAVDNILGEGE